eukprot:g22945.t1
MLRLSPTKSVAIGSTQFHWRIYLAGGFDGSFLSNVEVFDPAWNQWSSGPPMLQRRGGLGLVASRGQLFACGGRDGDSYHSTAECFQLPSDVSEPAEGHWQPLPALSQPRYCPAAVRFNGGVWLCGGLTRGFGSPYLNSTEFLGMDAATWSRGPPLKLPRASAAAAELRLGLIVCGGCCKEGPLGTDGLSVDFIYTDIFLQ